MDKKTIKLLDNYIDTESERISNNIINAVVHENLAKYNYNLLEVKYSNGDISYNIHEINKLTNILSKDIQNVLNEIDRSNVSKYYRSNTKKKFKHVKKGIVCEISLGSIRNSLLFANVGPVIPIKLFFLSQNNVDIDFKTVEYGINNIMIKVYLRVTLHEQITMPISSKRKKIVIEKPLTVNIIKGDVPYLLDKRIDR